MGTISVADSKKAFSQTMKKCSFVCSILVIFIHAYNLEVYKIGSDSIAYWIERFFSNFTACAVPFFFMSSAFFLYQKERKTGSVYKSRFKSIVLPYLWWNTLYMIGFSVLKKLSLSNVGLDGINIIDILKGIFLYKYNYVYWFMFSLILFTFLYPVIKQVIGRNRFICFSVLAILLVIDFFKIVNHNIVNSFVYYYIGAVAGHYYTEQLEKIATMHPNKKVACIVFCIFGFALSLVANMFHINITIIGNLAVILLLLIVLSVPRFKIPPFLLGLSFMIYSLHSILLECVEKIIYIVFPHNALWAMIDYFTAPAITFVMIVGLCAAMKKICPHLYEMLNGYRK